MNSSSVRVECPIVSTTKSVSLLKVNPSNTGIIWVVRYKNQAGEKRLTETLTRLSQETYTRSL